MPFKGKRARSGLHFAEKKEKDLIVINGKQSLSHPEIFIQKKNNLDSKHNTPSSKKSPWKTNNVQTGTNAAEHSPDSFKLPRELLFDLECSVLQDESSNTSKTFSSVHCESNTSNPEIASLLPSVVSELKRDNQLEVLEKCFFFR